MNLFDDLRTASRSLARRPGFAAVVVVTLAVALGANTAVFSVLQQTVLRPLPYSAAEDAVYITREAPQGGFEVSPMLEQVRDWRERAETVAELESFNDDRVVLRWEGAPRELTAAWVSPGLFGFLGVAPVLGTGFDGGSDREVVLSDALWRELYGGDPGALGESLRLGEDSYTVVGVMARGFRFVPPVEADLFLPMPAHPDKPIPATTLARLAPGVAPSAAEAELLALERRRAETDTASRSDGETLIWRPQIRDLGYLFSGDLANRVMLLQAAVALMLLIACANVGNLFLIRAEGRSREIAVRSALGAGRWRVARTLLLESVLLAGAGALLGLGVARWGGGLITGLYGGGRIELEALRLDPQVFGFTVLATTLAALAFGLVPAWTAARFDLSGVLKAGGRGAAGGAGGRTRAAMVVAEVALAVVLMVGAGLLTKSFLGLVGTDPGFEPDGLVTVSLELPQERYGTEEAQRAFVEELRRALARRGSSGLDEVALTSSVPSMASVFFGSKLEVEGRGRLPEGSVDLVSVVAADPGYFRTLGTRFLEGGPFAGAGAPGDTTGGDGSPDGAERGVVVNRNLARALWPAGDALGRRFRLGFSETESWLRVVGIVEDVAQLGLSSTHDTFQLYWSLHGSRRLSVVARAGDVAPELVGERVAAAVHAIDPWLPVPAAKSATELLGRTVAHERFEMTLMLAFAAVALALTVLGVYAVLAYAVRLRAFEIGVRSALGARPEQVLGLIVHQGGLLIGTGIVLGLAVSVALGRLIESQLHGVTTTDPAVLAATVGVLVVATAAATLVPARRAARLDPARVLRQE